MVSLIKGRNYFSLAFLAIAFIHFLITLLTDKLIFEVDDIWHNPVYIFIKLVVFSLIILFWQVVNFTCNGIKNKNKNIISFLKFFGIYFVFMLFFLLLTWPGIWRNDEIYILKYSVSLNFEFWHHWITTLFYMVSLSFFPFPGGIVFSQIIVISMIIGFIIYNLYKFVPNKWVYAYYIPFLFPSVISNNLHPMRMILCSYVELLFFSLVVFKYMSQSKIKKQDIILGACLLATISTWRSENIIYLFIVPIGMFFLFSNRIKLKQMLLFFLVTITFFLPIQLIQLKYGYGNSYFITAIESPLRDIILKPFKSNSPKEDLQTINNVIDVSDLKNYGCNAFWNGGLKKYSQEDLDKLKRTYCKLVIHNLPTFFRGRVNLLFDTNGYTQKSIFNVVGVPSKIYSNSKLLCELTDEYQYFSKHFKLNRPFNMVVREKVIEFLDGRTYTTNSIKPTIILPLFYNAFPSLLILISFIAIGLLKRNKLLYIIPTLILAKTFLIFITAPTALFIYYFPVYIAGNSFGVMALLLEKNQK